MNPPTVLDLSDPTHPDSPYNPANWEITPESVIADFERTVCVTYPPIEK